MTDHDEFDASELASAYLDGELSADESSAVRDHLSACAECRAKLAAREAVGRLVRQAPYHTAPSSRPTAGQRFSGTKQLSGSQEGNDGAATQILGLGL